MHIQMLDCLLPVYLTIDDGNLLCEQYKVAEHTTATYTAEEATAYWVHTLAAPWGKATHARITQVS